MNFRPDDAAAVGPEESEVVADARMKRTSRMGLRWAPKGGRAGSPWRQAVRPSTVLPPRCSPAPGGQGVAGWNGPDAASGEGTLEGEAVASGQCCIDAQMGAA